MVVTVSGTDSRGIATNGDLLTPAELAELARVSPQTVRRWRFDGDGPPAVRLGHRTVRYRRSDVDTWIDDRLSG